MVNISQISLKSQFISRCFRIVKLQQNNVSKNNNTVRGNNAITS